jgi:hypothetical protein
VDLFKIAAGKLAPPRTELRTEQGEVYRDGRAMNASVRAPAGFGRRRGVGVGHVASQTPTMPPPPPLQPSSLTFFFFHGSIRMLSGLNWFVALCVRCLCVSCVCV